eukprot:c25308_g5_i1 orf=249-458(+)
MISTPCSLCALRMDLSCTLQDHNEKKLIQHLSPLFLLNHECSAVLILREITCLQPTSKATSANGNPSCS